MCMILHVESEYIHGLSGHVMADNISHGQITADNYVGQPNIVSNRLFWSACRNLSITKTWLGITFLT